MLNSDYLRRQAAACQRIARATFDLATAEQLRYMAAELQTKADALERREHFNEHLNGSMPGQNGHF